MAVSRSSSLSSELLLSSELSFSAALLASAAFPWPGDPSLLAAGAASASLSATVLQGSGWALASPSLPGTALAVPWLWSASGAPSLASSLAFLGVDGRVTLPPPLRFLLQLSDVSGVLHAGALGPPGWPLGPGDSSGLHAGCGQLSAPDSKLPDCAFSAKNVRISCSMLSSLSTELLSPSEREGTLGGPRSGLVDRGLSLRSPGAGRIVLEMSRIASAHISSVDVSAWHGDRSANSLLEAVFPGGAGALVSFGGLQGWSGSRPPRPRSRAFEATGFLPGALLWVSGKALFAEWPALCAGGAGPCSWPGAAFGGGSPLASRLFSRWYSWMASSMPSSLLESDASRTGAAPPIRLPLAPGPMLLLTPPLLGAASVGRLVVAGLGAAGFMPPKLSGSVVT